MNTSLNAARRTRELDALTTGEPIDVLVVGGGITGVGVALDAVSRGLRTVLVEVHDLAFGTSRWSSKLIHGGLRYVGSGHIGIAMESAAERHILITKTAPHLIRPLGQLVPLIDGISTQQGLVAGLGFLAGDVLRARAGTPTVRLPRAKMVSAERARELTPALRVRGLRGGLLANDGQVVDDARLVLTVARTAAGLGASILTRVKASDLTGTSATLTDTLTGQSMTVAARAVISATGVWAGQLDPSINLRPGRGAHLVFDAARLGNPTAALTVPVAGSMNRFVFALPQQLGRVTVGLTDVDASGPIPDMPVPSDAEVDFLLDTINRALTKSLRREDIRGSFAGLRPLIDSGDGSTADLSREHAILESRTGTISVVGGKLTVYRKMAQDAVDFAITNRGLPAVQCRTRDLPLIGAPGHVDTAKAPRGHASLVARHGGLSRAVIDGATVPRPLDQIAPGIDVIRAEIEYAIRHEGALDTADILERRTRIGLVPDDAKLCIDNIDEICATLPATKAKD